MRKAMLYQKLEDLSVQCGLCRHECVIKPGKKGLCHVRENRDGDLFALNYHKVAARSADPIEKKPLFHFYPGSFAYSVAAMGCNFACAHCQNASLSRGPADHGLVEGIAFGPEKIVKAAKSSGCKSISFTYSEPTVFAELALDTARLAKEEGILCNFVTNGYQSPELIHRMGGLIHGANIDIKAFSESFYKKVCRAKLGGVLDTVKRMHDLGIWIEITTLLIPGLNDREEEVSGLARFLAELDPAIPWHISRYHPAYRMLDRPPTSVQSLAKVRRIGKEAGLHYVYTGNVPGDEGENTLCHSCQALLIKRVGYQIQTMNLIEDRCPQCQTPVAGRF